MKNLKDVLNTLPTERRAKIEARAKELIEEGMTLCARKRSEQNESKTKKPAPKS